MATTEYFNRHVADAASDQVVRLEIGRTNFAGEGPQVYMKLGDSEVILSHEDAKAFCEQVADVASYFGYQK
jgi:hypothetical protein